MAEHTNWIIYKTKDPALYTQFPAHKVKNQWLGIPKPIEKE